MKFLVDAQLPAGLCEVLKNAGHEALHTSQLPAQNRTTDQVINDLSQREEQVVISKDTDFYYSHVLSRKPWKLVLVRTGNIRTRELRSLLENHLPALLSALETHSLVELDREALRILS